MLKLALISLFTLNAFAHDFKLYRPENSTFQDYSFEEMSTRLGTDKSLLPQYRCNGIDEADFFWPALVQNQQRDSLKIQLYQSETKLIYKDGKFYQDSGAETTDLSNIFIKYVAAALRKIEELPEGQQLLRALESSRYPLTITFGGNSSNPQTNSGRDYHGIHQANALTNFVEGRMSNEDISFESIGAGGKINWDPKTTGVAPYVALAHEMYHAFDSIRGLLDMRFVVGEKYEHAFVSEYRAVYFENMVRKASNIPYRTHYGQDPIGPGVLDDKGEPIKLNSPCLK